ncbi:DUF1643 domain-containing protein [filamentous cyanobacterium LEGE 11480]|uniref:DUF1643 domain-containing protein n=1 Tax=Romeriopsis navalis LEGE 11480 TaxID=2777977 RepID=A0A928VP28_9CYAN|nr:DUF1643 domain-containing protein [Romeriopsis navalis]MBE9032076.1 DUF1643 domain-containing protein [Romeriopsis navalis LEGE 11480]
MEYVATGATISPCQQYRYQLWRQWHPGPSTCTIIGLNPSTADATRDDPTIRRCVGFAQSLGCDRLIMVNLFAYRATKPEDLRKAKVPIGQDNNQTILSATQTAKYVIAAWGVHGDYRGRDRQVYELLVDRQIPLCCFGTTKYDHPRHPLYLPKTTALQAYSMDICHG